MLKQLSIPEGLIVSIEDFKARIRFEGATGEEDDDIEKIIRAATARAQHATGRILLPTEFEFTFDGWCDVLNIPVVPIRNFSGVAYFDVAHAEQTVSSYDWYSSKDERGGVISFVNSFTNPPLSSRPRPVKVLFSAGYDDPADVGEDPELAPNPIDQHMVMMLAGHWYRNRNSVSDKPMTAVPQGFEDLVADRRIYR